MSLHKNIYMELSQRFYFEAAHTLHRSYETEGSLKIHGHTYESEISVSGTTNPESGMLVDLALLRKEIERIRLILDHQFLDEVPNLGPATLENLCFFIKNEIVKTFPNLSQVMVERRASGDKCILKSS